MSIPTDFLTALLGRLGPDNVLTEAADRWPYGSDNSRRQATPDLVVYAHSHADIQSIVRLCNQYQIPLIVRGRGTGTTGATVPLTGGLVVSLERMNRILEVCPQDRYIVAEPGVTNADLQRVAAEHGFFWPPDPTSAEFCTIGGNLAYNSAGPRAVKYGTPRENTLGLRAVTGTGEEIRTGVFTSKGVVGYDLTRLLIGSEGTLAIITEATLKLSPQAKSIRTIQATYNGIQSAARAVSSIMAQAVVPCALEFIDKAAMNMIRDYADIDLPVADAMLMVEVDGEPEHMETAIHAIETAAQNDGLVSINIARSETERQALWQIRKALSPALRKIAPKKINEDVVVPVSKIPDLLHGLERLSQTYGIPIVNFGHAGNGNIHVNLLIDPDDRKQMESAEHCLSEMFDLVLSLQGTLSGEHGVGLEKKDFVDREIDPVTLSLMKGIKQQFDPNNIMNPGKTLPD